MGVLRCRSRWGSLRLFQFCGDGALKLVKGVVDDGDSSAKDSSDHGGSTRSLRRSGGDCTLGARALYWCGLMALMIVNEECHVGLGLITTGGRVLSPIGDGWRITGGSLGEG